uniref:hypothetical protein n=1 Tax=Anaerotruncus rubiinfantis TaxID=1720200 RepID=UPI003D79B0E2
KLAGIAENIIRTTFLTVLGWQGSKAPYTQTLPVAGVTGENTQVIEVGLDEENATVEQRTIARAAMLAPTARGVNSVTITADGEKPAVDLPIVIVILG